MIGPVVSVGVQDRRRTNPRRSEAAMILSVSATLCCIMESPLYFAVMISRIMPRATTYFRLRRLAITVRHRLGRPLPTIVQPSRLAGRAPDVFLQHARRGMVETPEGVTALDCAHGDAGTRPQAGADRSGNHQPRDCQGWHGPVGAC
jgi:hypothetical protein